MTAISPRQRDVLEFIMQHTVKFQLPPSIREISTFLGITSLRGSVVHLECLERKGYIVRDYCLPRGIRVLKNADGQDVRLSYEVVQ